MTLFFIVIAAVDWSIEEGGSQNSSCDDVILSTEQNRTWRCLYLINWIVI